MGFFFAGQFLYYLALAGPKSAVYRVVLGSCLLVCAMKSPLAALSGLLWEFLNLGLHPELLCDPRYWMVCSSPHPGVVLGYLVATPMGHFALRVRGEFETLCLAWHPLWGRLAFSLSMGGAALDDFKSLYKNLGFLHVLVISGSQFVLLAQVFSWILRLPLRALYASRGIRWPWFRVLSLLFDLILLALLLLYLLTCGAAPPCQRAFLSFAHRLYWRWMAPSRLQDRYPRPSAAARVFMWQALLFPEACFSLSSLLSWGATFCLQIFGGSKRIAEQLKISILIQLLNLAIFGRLSVSSLVLDFFIAPLWDVLLLVCLTGAFLIPLQYPIAYGLDLMHLALLRGDRWEWGTFGSSALGFRPEIMPWGSLLALGVFGLWLFSERAKRILVREKSKGERICAPS